MRPATIVILLVYFIGLIFVAGSLGTKFGSEIGAFVFGSGLILISLSVGIGYFIHPPK